MSRARWFIFLRRVYQYQNGPRSDLGSNPFNSSGWLALELGVIVAQMVITTTVVATSPKERPAWPLRLWVCAYNVGNVLSLPLLYWRHRHSSATGRGDDPEMHGAGDALRNSSYLMNKARAFLELFFAMWFVMGNVWVFDARLGSFHRAPRLYALCIGLLAWNAVVYSLPFLLFLLLCCFVPVVGYALGYNMNSASVGRGASDEQLDALPRWRFKEPDVPRDREKDDQECCICLAQYREKEEDRLEKKKKNDRTLHASSEPKVEKPPDNEVSISDVETQPGSENSPSDNDKVNDDVHEDSQPNNEEPDNDVEIEPAVDLDNPQPKIKAPRVDYSLLIVVAVGMMKIATGDDYPLRQGAGTGLDWFSMAMEPRGGGTFDLG
ncbi:hypothetical protein TRIUR3_26831 [Triticum urartu]|uniref:Uncharacterized protein n=1 Tax=Triticum urartu TaxID=4572 RepID=M7Y8K2_TRIUA|nr:hypothetical protein TRIUR3_26831 [Triticum urartu]